MVTTYVRQAVGRPEPEGVGPVSAIDDLIKFRLVESMLRQPDTAASAQGLAARLGFYSVDVTAMALDEMVSAGLLRATRRRGELVYALVGDPRVRSEVAELVAQGPPSLLTRLAAGSVSRIRKLLRKAT
ncbi:MAG TPA: hypothetical protein VG370_08535 [Chloroflexota bacterium]|nr:hypothetical protein [Chloroflexota bacterium]